MFWSKLCIDLNQCMEPCVSSEFISARIVCNEEEEEPLLIYTAQGSPFRRKKLSVNVCFALHFCFPF